MIKPTDFYDLLSDETRLRCVLLLHHEGELCVCELSQALQSSQPKISRHLSMLRNSGVVCDERRGQWVYYRLNPKLPNWAQRILEVSRESLQKVEPLSGDIQRHRSGKKDTLCP